MRAQNYTSPSSTKSCYCCMRQLEHLRQLDELSGYCSKYGRSAVVKMKKNYKVAMFTVYVLQKKKVNRIFMLFEDLLPLHYSNGRRSNSYCANQSSPNSLLRCQRIECYTIKHEFSYWRLQKLVVKVACFQFKRYILGR